MASSCCLIMVLFNGCPGGEVFSLWWLSVKEELLSRLPSTADEGAESLPHAGTTNCLMSQARSASESTSSCNQHYNHKHYHRLDTALQSVAISFNKVRLCHQHVPAFPSSMEIISYVRQQRCAHWTFLQLLVKHDIYTCKNLNWNILIHLTFSITYII